MPVSFSPASPPSSKPSVLPTGLGGVDLTALGISSCMMDVCAATSDTTGNNTTSNVVGSDISLPYIFDKSLSNQPLGLTGSGASAYWLSSHTADGIAFDSTETGADSTFLRKFHRTDYLPGGKSAWCLVQAPPVWGTDKNYLMGSQNDNPVQDGWNLHYDNDVGAGASALGVDIMNGSTVTTIRSDTSALGRVVLTPGEMYLIGVNITYAGGEYTIEFFVNSAYSRSSGSAAVVATDDPVGSTALMLGNDDSNTRIALNTRFYGWWMFEDTLSDDEIRTLRDKMELRRELSTKIWQDAPTDMQGIRVHNEATTWIGMNEFKIYDDAGTDVSQTICATAGSKGDTSWDDTTTGEFSTNSTYSSAVANINNGNDSDVMWSSDANGDMITFFNYGSALDRLSKTDYLQSGSYDDPDITYYDKDDNVIVPSYVYTVSNREYALWG